MAEAAVNSGTKGSTKHLTTAIRALQEMIDYGNFDPASRKGAEIYDLRSTLFAMRAEEDHQKEDYVEGVRSAARAIEGVWRTPSTSAAAGAHYHLAQAHREYGKWLTAQGQPAAARKSLEQALAGFQQMEEAYRQGFPDAPYAELKGPLKAVSDAVRATREFLNELP